MRISLFTLIIAGFVVFSSSSSPLTLNCDFSNDGWDSAVPTVYKCEVKNLMITSRENSTITHITGKQNLNEKVTAVRIFNQICNFFPQNIFKFLKDIEAVAVQNSQLKDLTKADLKDFKNLKSLSLYGNELKILEFRIFEANLKLEFLSVYGNKIHSVGSEILRPLKSLKKVFFHSNICLDFDALSEDEIKLLMMKLTNDCPPSFELEKIKEKDEKLEKFEKDFEKISLKFSTLKIQIKNLEDANKNLAKNNQNSTCGINENLAFELSRCDARLKELTTTVTNFDIECVTFIDGHCVADDVITFYEEMKVKSVKFNGTILTPTKVTTLEISGRNFHYMPENFEYFGNLKNLTITHTKVYGIEKFTANLTTLKLTNNKIEKIKEVHIESLEILDLSQNQLEKLPEIFSNFPNLREIYLDFNSISTLRWKIFSQNAMLEKISLRGNKLSQIGSNLEIIGSIDGDWDEMWKVDKIDSEDVTTIYPFSITEVDGQNSTKKDLGLKFLDLSENFCIDSQHPDKSLSSMVKIFSSNCTIWIEIVDKFPQTEYIVDDLEVDAENTKIHQNFTSNLTKFTSNDQNLIFMPKNIQEIFPNLTFVEISRSNLQKVPNFFNLLEISVSKNEIKKLYPENFDNSLQIEVIDVSYNKISFLPSKIFVKLLKLKIINLNTNYLTILNHDIIAKSNSIVEFHCASNKLEEIDPQIVKNLKHSNLIDFNGNFCVDNKFKHDEHNEKKIMEIYGEIVFKCGS